MATSIYVIPVQEGDWRPNEFLPESTTIPTQTPIESTSSNIPIVITPIYLGEEVTTERHVAEKADVNVDKKPCGKGSGLGMIFVWLIVIFLGAVIIMLIVPPAFILNPETQEINLGKLILAAAIVALLGTIIVWIILSCWS